MRNLFLIFSFLISIKVFAQTCPTITNSSSFKMNQVLLTYGTDFDLETSTGSNAGKIVQKIFNWGRTFQLLNESDQLVAIAKKEVFSWGVRINIYDCNSVHIGSIQENILQSLLKVSTTYSILGSDNKLIGQSEKLEILSTDLVFYDKSKNNIAEAHRPWVRFLGDKWSLDIHATDKVDKRLVIFIPVFKTSNDDEKK